MNLFERICDRLFWTFVLLFAITLALVIMAVDFFFELFFPGQFDALKDRFFSSQAGDAIVSYRAFQKEHPVLCWFLKWPLMLFGM